MARKGTPKKSPSRYTQLLVQIFLNGWKPGIKEFNFKRTDLETVARKLGVDLPKNLGDVVYSYRYRQGQMPAEIAKRTPKGNEWIIVGAGKALYRFRLINATRIAPSAARIAIKVPEATPEIIAANRLNDEQALLARVRYNRLIDIFLGMTAYSLQNHLRTTAKEIGQIEIDEVYVGIDRNGRQYIVPVQAKGGSDALSKVQTLQDLAYAQKVFPHLICRPVSAQFMGDDVIALFELGRDGDDIKIVDERHYKLVAAADISTAELEAYRRGGS